MNDTLISTVEVVRQIHLEGMTARQQFATEIVSMCEDLEKRLAVPLTSDPKEIDAVNEKYSHLEIAIASMSCFQDGRLDVEELDSLVSIAQRNGSISPDEARVLAGVIDKLNPAELDARMKLRIEEVRALLAPVL